MTGTTPPVLLVVFNRPDATRRVLDALRVNRPRELYVAGDGPRAGVPRDAAPVEATRRLIEQIDWDCRVHTRYEPQNVGLQRAMIGAIGWFFDEVEAGVILEDDCVPAPSFLPLAGELLERYAARPEVMHVSGLNMASQRYFQPYSYGFARTGHVWGWATWRRAWAAFDPELSSWPDARRQFLADAPPLYRVLARKFDSAHAGRKRTWSRAWYWAVASRQGLATIPATNLIENVGIGPDATHGPSPGHPLRRPVLPGVSVPLHHPSLLAVDATYERLLVGYHRGSYRRRAEDLVWSLRSSVSRNG